MEKKLVSIIIPTYNRAHLIGETIVSIQNQSYENWECIIVDDGSTDNTEILVFKLIKNDSRILFYKKNVIARQGSGSEVPPSPTKNSPVAKFFVIFLDF